MFSNIHGYHGSVLLPIIVISSMVSLLLLASVHMVTHDLGRVLLFRKRLVACEQADRALTLLHNQSLSVPFRQTWLGVQVIGDQVKDGVHIQANNHGVLVSLP